MDLRIVDVGPRDGLQNETVILSPEVRAEFCMRLFSAGISCVEAVSFVQPKLVPQMAGAEEVLTHIERRPNTVLAGLVLNERGYDRALQTSIDEIHYSFGVTDAFCERNQRSTVAESLTLAHTLIARARADARRITVTLSVAFGCPFEGRVDPKHVLTLAEDLQRSQPDELVVADTIGVAVPTSVRTLIRSLKDLGVAVGGHFHNTRNTGYANAVAALEAGATTLDASLGGIGGCPFAPRATGNIATEDLVYLLHEMGYQTGIDLDLLLTCSLWLSEQLEKELPGQVYRAGTFR